MPGRAGWEDLRLNTNERLIRSSQVYPQDTTAVLIEHTILAGFISLGGCLLFLWVRSHALNLKYMWAYRDLRGLENAKVKVPPLWRGRSWWLWATPKQCHDAAALIEKAREETNYYAVYSDPGDPKNRADMMLTIMGFFFFASILYAVLEWISPTEEPDDEDGNRPGFFRVSGVCMLIKLACYGADFFAQAVARTPIGGNFQVEFFLSWVILWSSHIANAMLVLACIHGCKSLWETIFGDRPAFNGPETVLFLVTVFGALGIFESLESNGMSEAEQAMVARARRCTKSAWYDEGDLGHSFKAQVQDDFWEDVDERVSEIWENAVATQPCKLTKAQRKALGKEREARREAERLAQKKRDRQEAKEQKARARAMQAATIRRAVERAGLPSDAPYEERPPLLTREQVLEARYTRALANAELARRRLEEFEDEYAERMALLDEERAAIQGRLEAPDSGSGSGSGEGSGDDGPSHSDHVDAADLALQTQRNKEEAERQRRVREQREKEKAAQSEKEYSEAGPSHKEGAPKWVEEPLNEGEKAKREAEKVASLLRKQEQQRERVREKEAREKRESERLQSLKTGKRILQGNAYDRASNNNNVQRSSLQPLREDEPAPTLTLADVSLQFQEDPRFRSTKDDDLESVATTVVPAMLTHHAEERKEERKYTAYQIKHTLKYGRVEEGNQPDTYVHYPRREGDPKVVTDSDGSVLTVI